LFARIGFDPQADFTFADFAQLPVLERDEVRRAGSNLISSIVPTAALRKDSTGGSSGVPTEIWLGPEELGWRESGLEFPLEARACGCPVIGPDVSGVNECLTPARGSILYPFEMEADALAKLIVETLRDKEKMCWRSEACARYMRAQFSLRRMAKDYLRIYQEAPHPQYAMTCAAKIYPASKRLFDVPSHLYRQAAESGARWLRDCVRRDTASASKYEAEWRFFLSLFRYRYRNFMEREGQGDHCGKLRAAGEIARFARIFVKSKAARSVANTVGQSSPRKAE